MLRGMKRSKGFTLIEILVTITIMVILMTLAVASVRSTQVRARDEDRKNDAENIVRQLDSLYTKGFSFPYPDSSTTVTLRGSYPTTDQMDNDDTVKAIFAELPPKVLISPNWESISIGPADDNTSVQSPSATDEDSANAPAYIYQPFATDGALCTDAYLVANPTQECRKFNLYYKTETNGTVVVLKSKNR